MAVTALIIISEYSCCSWVGDSFKRLFPSGSKQRPPEPSPSPFFPLKPEILPVLVSLLVSCDDRYSGHPEEMPTTSVSLCHSMKKRRELLLRVWFSPFNTLFMFAQMAFVITTLALISMLFWRSCLSTFALLHWNTGYFDCCLLFEFLLRGTQATQRSPFQLHSRSSFIWSSSSYSSFWKTPLTVKEISLSVWCLIIIRDFSGWSGLQPHEMTPVFDQQPNLQMSKTPLVSPETERQRDGLEAINMFLAAEMMPLTCDSRKE